MAFTRVDPGTRDVRPELDPTRSNLYPGMYSRNLHVSPRGSQIDLLATFSEKITPPSLTRGKGRTEHEIFATTLRRILLPSVYLATTQSRWPALSDLSYLRNGL